MKTNYKVRAQNFIAKFVEYAGDRNWNDIFAMEELANAFSRDCHRNVVCVWGAARCCLITSDYVIKWDYDEEAVKVCGGCENECEMYQNAIAMGFGHLLAESSMIEYAGHKFEIMPRIKGIGVGNHWYGFYVNDVELQWLEGYIGDLHSGNYAIVKGKLIITDYACRRHK